MTWCVGNGIDEVIGLDNRETSGGPPSPDTSRRWIDRGFEDSWLPVATNPYLISEEYNLAGNCLVDQILMENVSSEEDHSRGSSVCGGSSEDFLQHAALAYDCPDFSQDDLAEAKEINDILWSSFLEEDLFMTDDTHESSYLPPGSQGCLLTTENPSANESIPSTGLSMDAVNNLMTHEFEFASSLGWGKGEATASNFIPFASKQKNHSPTRTLHSMNSMDGPDDGNGSAKYSELAQLKIVIAQLSMGMRICFRDSLYRLAKNSKQRTTTQSKNGNLMGEKPNPEMSHDETIRFVEDRATEPENSIIDRAIADFMLKDQVFSKAA